MSLQRGGLRQHESPPGLVRCDQPTPFTAAIDARLVSRERAEWELFGTDFNETFDTKQAEHNKLKAADMLPVPKAGAPAPAPVAVPTNHPEAATP